MAIQEVEQIDYLAEAKDRLTIQFADKEIVNKYLALLIEQEYKIQEVFTDLIQKRSIDTASGVMLDIIGDIVGQPREMVDAALIQYFAFDGYPLAASYGDLENTSTGGYYWSLGQPLAGNILLNDEQYRLFIRAKIMKNATTATPDEFLQFISFVFNAEMSVIIAEGNAEFTVLVGKELSLFERTLLSYISKKQGYNSYFVHKPVGVKINFGHFPSENFFSFQGVRGASGYGSLSDTYDGTITQNGVNTFGYTKSFVGGKLASLI